MVYVELVPRGNTGLLNQEHKCTIADLEILVPSFIPVISFFK